MARISLSRDAFEHYDAATRSGSITTEDPAFQKMGQYASLPLQRSHSFTRARVRSVHHPQPLWVWAVVVALTVGPLLLLLTNPGEIPDDVRMRGGLLWILTMLPTVVYFATPVVRRPPIPALPMLGMLFGLYYPLQLLLGIPNANDLVSLDARVDYYRPTNMALYGWISLLVGTVLLGLVMPGASRTPRPRWNPARLKRWAFLMQIGGLALDVARLELPVPVAVRGLLNFAGMLSLFGSCILLVLARRGNLDHAETLRFWGGAIAIATVQLTTGSVANFARAGIVILLAAWIAGARPRFRIAVIGVTLVALVVTLRGFAIDFRRQAWGVEDMSQAERTGLWYSLIRDHADKHGLASVVGHGTVVVASRSANMDLYADVIRQTPNSVPFWGGQTYLSLIGAFVPRVLWPSKPQKRLGQDFGHRYGYLHPNDQNTSINLPFVVEFYANFGEIGVIIGMFIVGCILAVLGRLLNHPRQDWVRSLCGVVLLVPIVTNVESDFSLVFGGLILNGFALYLVYRFLVQRATRPVRGSLVRRSSWPTDPPVHA